MSSNEPVARESVSLDAWVIGLVSALVGLTALGFGRFAYALLLPLTREGLNLSYTQAGLIGSANLFGFLTGALLGGSLAGVFGARPVVGTALALAALGAITTASSHAVALVALAQGLVGFGAGAGIVPAQNVPIAWFPSNQRGFASGLVSVGIGAVATDLVGARLVHPAMALVNVVGAFGQMSGPVVTGYAVDLTRSFVPGLLLASAVAFLGGAAALALAETRQRDGMTAARPRRRYVAGA